MVYYSESGVNVEFAYSMCMEIKAIKRKTVTVIAVGWCLFQLYTGFFGVLAPMQQRPIHVAFMLVLLFLTRPISKKLDADKIYIDQIVAIVLTIVASSYLIQHHFELAVSIGNYTNYELFVGAVILVLVIEGARRVVGWPLLSIGMFFMLYTYVGRYMPQAIRHPGFNIPKIISFMTLNVNGIYGVCIEVCASFIFLFILYSKFLEETGGGPTFIALSSALVGHVRGGPAKVAVIASSLLGTITGSAVANVVGSGPFTIPLMKKTGYDSHFAAAVEAVSSAGGQFMPPIMGSSAFLIAEILSIPYWQVAISCLFPAILYYVAVFFMVDLEAARKGLLGVDKSHMPRVGVVMKNGWPSLISPVVLVYLLAVIQFSPGKSAAWSIAIAFAISMIKKSTRLTMKRLIETLEAGAIGSIETSSVCAAVGVIIGSIIMSGLALKLSGVLIYLSGGNVVVLLILTMIGCLIIGLGLPTVACYIMLAVMVCPALIKMGVYPLAAHLFVFYYGIISAITPPVALVSFVAAGLAEASFMKTCMTAVRLGLSAYILPFVFVFNPALILHGTILEITQVVFTSALGIYSLSIALIGYFLTNVPMWQRGLFAIAAITLIVPEGITDIIGICLFAATAFGHYALRGKEKGGTV